MTARYGNRTFSSMYRDINRLSMAVAECDSELVKSAYAQARAIIEMTASNDAPLRDFAQSYRDINALRAAIRAEGSPAVQEAWDRCEEFIDAVFQKEKETK